METQQNVTFVFIYFRLSLIVRDLNARNGPPREADCAHCIASWAQEQSKCKNSNNNNDHDRTMYKTFSQKDRLTPTVRCWKATHSNVIITMWQCNRPYDSIYIYIYIVRDIKKIYGTFASARSHTHDHMLDGERTSERISFSKGNFSSMCMTVNILIVRKFNSFVNFFYIR